MTVTRSIGPESISTEYSPTRELAKYIQMDTLYHGMNQNLHHTSASKHYYYY